MFAPSFIAFESSFVSVYWTSNKHLSKFFLSALIGPRELDSVLISENALSAFFPVSLK